MSDPGANEPPPKAGKGYRFVPKRPPPPREELLRILKADEPVSMGEIHDALTDGRLTSQEARDLIAGWKEMEESAKEMAQQAKASYEALIKATGFDSIVEMQKQWREQLKPIIDASQLAKTETLVASALAPPRDYELEALVALRVEIGKVAQILETSGEQIGVTAKLAATTVASLERVHGETKALRDDLRGSNSNITRLTWGLIGLGVVTAGLTAVLVWLTWVLAHQQH